MTTRGVGLRGQGNVSYGNIEDVLSAEIRHEVEKHKGKLPTVRIVYCFNVLWTYDSGTAPPPVPVYLFCPLRATNVGAPKSTMT